MQPEMELVKSGSWR